MTAERRSSVCAGHQKRARNNLAPPSTPACLTDSLFKQPNKTRLRRPVSLRRRVRRRVVGEFRVAPVRTEGARDARVPGAHKFTQCAQTWVLGPTGLDASRHRGLSKSLFVPQVRQNQRRPARGVWRFAPRRSPGVGRLCAMRLLPPLRDQALGPNASDRRPAVPAVRAPRRYVEAPGASRLGPPGGKCAPHLRRPSPGHRSPPRVWRR